MNNKHPITPPPELVEQLMELPLSEEERIAAAYRAGADQELEACCEWLKAEDYLRTPIDLRAARRPKPPSLKEQALEALARQERGRDRGFLSPEAMADADTIRRAIEALPDTP